VICGPVWKMDAGVIVSIPRLLPPYHTPLLLAAPELSCIVCALPDWQLMQENVAVSMRSSEKMNVNMRQWDVWRML
jgi:hypothetical protein